MTWAEFRSWAWDTFQVRLPRDAHGEAWRVIWRGRYVNGSKAGTGIGNWATYGFKEQHRLAFWLRMRPLVAKAYHYAWMLEADEHEDGWLVNDGSGIRWVADPAKEAHELVERGFVAVKCGL